MTSDKQNVELSTKWLEPKWLRSVVGCCVGCCCCFGRWLTKRAVYVNMLLRSHCAGALNDEELFIVEGTENWRSTPGQPGEEREKCGKTAKKTHRRHTTLEACPSLLRTKMSTTSGDKLNLMHFHRSRDNCRCMITAMSITADMHLRHQHDMHNRDIGHLKTNGNWRISVVC